MRYYFRRFGDSPLIHRSWFRATSYPTLRTDSDRFHIDIAPNKNTSHIEAGSVYEIKEKFNSASPQFIYIEKVTRNNVHHDFKLEIMGRYVPKLEVFSLINNP